MYNVAMDDDSKQDPKMVNISDIQNAGFSDDMEPKDDRLIDLLKLAYTKKIYCRTVIVAIDDVFPFSDYEPSISEDYFKYFKEKYESGRPPGMLVYQRDDGKFVFSVPLSLSFFNQFFMFYRMLSNFYATRVVFGAKIVAIFSRLLILIVQSTVFTFI